MQLFLVVVVICGNIVYQHAYGALRVVRNSSQTHHEYRDMPACTSPVAIISLHLCQTQSTLVVSVCYHQSKIQSQIERGWRALVDFDGFWVNCRCVSVHPPRQTVCLQTPSEIRPRLCCNLLSWCLCSRNSRISCSTHANHRSSQCVMCCLLFFAKRLATQVIFMCVRMLAFDG